MVLICRTWNHHNLKCLGQIFKTHLSSHFVNHSYDIIAQKKSVFLVHDNVDSANAIGCPLTDVLMFKKLHFDKASRFQLVQWGTRVLNGILRILKSNWLPYIFRQRLFRNKNVRITNTCHKIFHALERNTASIVQIVKRHFTFIFLFLKSHRPQFYRQNFTQKIFYWKTISIITDRGSSKHNAFFTGVDRLRTSGSCSSKLDFLCLKIRILCNFLLQFGNQVGESHLGNPLDSWK